MPAGIIRAYRKAQRARQEYLTQFSPEALEGKHVVGWIEGVIWELERLYPALKALEAE